MDRLDWYGRPVSPYEIVIDGRQILERIEEIESEHTDDQGEVASADAWVPADAEEYRTLCELRDEVGEDACRNGVTLVRENHFEDYVRDEFLEIGPELYEYRSKSGRASWNLEYVRVPLDELFMRLPFSKIDWSDVALEQWSYYSQTTFTGILYLYRAE